MYWKKKLNREQATHFSKAHYLLVLHNAFQLLEELDEKSWESMKK